MVDILQYEGPTTAERFIDDMAARRAMFMLKIDIPSELEMEAVTSRYFVGAQVGDKGRSGEARRFVFIDGSAAKLNRRGRWVVN